MATVLREEYKVENGRIVESSGSPAPKKVNYETVHHCPRCGSYFYGRFEGFDGNPYFCGNCGLTYPALSIEALREMHRKNGTLAKFDAGELVEDCGTIDIAVSDE